MNSVLSSCIVLLVLAVQTSQNVKGDSASQNEGPQNQFGVTGSTHLTLFPFPSTTFLLEGWA